MSDDRHARMLEREAHRSCGDDGPMITGAPEGWWEACLARVGAEQERMRREADGKGGRDEPTPSSI